MTARTIRLWAIPATAIDPARVEVLARTTDALARPARVGGRVFDVSGVARREDAVRLLELAKSVQPDVQDDPDGWARVAAARARVVEVEVTRG